MKIKNVKGRGIPVPGDDIDTDRIIPARYLKLVTFKDLGKYAFYDVRFDGKGNKKKHPFNDKKFQGASILIVNKNFGCGSSREHAPQSLMRHGIIAIIGESFAEIFEGNCTALGVPTVIAQKPDIDNLMSVIEDDPSLEIRIDLEDNAVSYGDFSFPIKQKESSKIVLTKGRWDSLAELKENEKKVKSVSKELPYLNDFKVQ
jgi:3-isopropylmalate/(R)-2-methylmalate dehydratase small subunit